MRGRGLGSPRELLWEVRGQCATSPAPLYYYSSLGAPSPSPHVRVASKAVHPGGKAQKHMQRADVINLIAAGAEPYAKTGSFILRTLGVGGYAGRTLVGPGGPTPLARLWAETTGRQLPERGFRMDQPTIHHGVSEFIKKTEGGAASGPQMDWALLYLHAPWPGLLRREQSEVYRRGARPNRRPEGCRKRPQARWRSL